MKKIAAVLFMVALGAATPGLAQCYDSCVINCRFLTMSADVFVDTSNGYHGSGRVVCYNSFMNQFCGEFAARTWTIDTSTGVVLAEDGKTMTQCTDIWNGASGGIGTYSECFQQRTSAVSPTYYENEVGSAQACNAPPPIRYRLEVWTCLDGSCSLNNNDLHDAGNTVVVYTSGPSNFQFNGWSGDVSSTSGMTAEVYMDGNKSVSANWSSPPPPPPNTDPINNYDNSGCPQYQNCNSPIIINFSRGMYALTGAASPVMFDINDAGGPIRIGWTAAGADEAFLCLDRNGTGMIESGAELFGTATHLLNGQRAANGFVALAEFDDDHDGVIDAKDAIWPKLLLWRDSNHDGLSQPSELTRVAGSGLTAISVDSHWTGRRDGSGNTFRYESHVWIQDGAGQATPRPVYDVFFIGVPSTTTH